MKPPTTLEEALAVIQALLKENQLLRERIAELESKLSKNSKNSSKPPSSDIKSNTKVGKNRGGAKPGHKGYCRAPIPIEKINRQVVVRPKECSRCGSHNLESERKPVFHHVIDLPKIEADITRYRLEKCRCLDCGKHTRASLPQGVSSSLLGPRLTAWIGSLASICSLSLRKTQCVVFSVLRENFCSATIFACQQRVNRSLEEPFEKICQAFSQELSVGADETGWRTTGQRRWVWVKSGKATTLFRIQKGRSRLCAEILLGKNSKQPLVTDRYPAYASKGPHQYCLAHWNRDIEALTGNYPDAYNELSFDLKEVFAIHRLYREQKIKHDQFQQRIRYRRRRMKETLSFWATAGPENLRRRCRSWLKSFDRYWTFVRIEGMEPTNNQSERDLRDLVIRRKICFGTRSDAGERFVERIYSVAKTLSKRGADLFEYIEANLRNHWKGLPAASLPEPCV